MKVIFLIWLEVALPVPSRPACPGTHASGQLWRDPPVGCRGLWPSRPCRRFRDPCRRRADAEGQDEKKKFIKVLKEVRVERDDAYAFIKPFDGFKVSFSIDFNHPVQRKFPAESTVDFSSTSFVREVCRARTHHQQL